MWHLLAGPLGRAVANISAEESSHLFTGPRSYPSLEWLLYSVGSPTWSRTPLRICWQRQCERVILPRQMGLLTAFSYEIEPKPEGAGKKSLEARHRLLPLLVIGAGNHFFVVA